MRTIKIEAPIKPIPFKRVSFSGGHRYNPKQYRAFKEELGWYALRAMKGQDLLKGALRLDVKVYKKRRDLLTKCWGDVDNFTKAVMDSLNGICYEDDAQIVQINAQKLIGEPQILIKVRELNAT